MVEGYQRPTSSELTLFKSEFDSAKTADTNDRARGIRNMMAYLSLYMGQYPEELRHELQMAGRNPAQYNFLQYLIRGHGGNVLMNWVDPQFNLRDDGPLDAAEAIGKIYYANKEHNNYKINTLGCIEDGYCYRGVQELTIEKPTENPREWSVGFPKLRPDMVIFDQNNLSDRISRNSQMAHKMTMMTAKMMARIWNKRGNDILRGMIRQAERDGSRFDRTEIDEFENLDYPQIGHMWLVVEKLWIREMKVTKRYLKINGKIDPTIEFPETNAKIGSPEDIAIVMDWALRNGIELNDDMVVEHNCYRPTNWITTVCPDLGVVLENRKDPRQLDGHLPLYAWSFIQKMGKSVGLIDLLWDVQQDFNKRQMAKTKGITQSPIWGKSWVSKDVVDENDDQTLQDVVENFNDVSKPLVVPSGLPADKLFGIMPGTNLPAALLQDEGFKLELADRIASLPVAMQGLTQRSGESGVHFGRKVIEGSVMQRMPMEWIMQHENDKAEDWFLMARKLYGSKVNINREFKFNKGREKVVINQFGGYDENGDEVWRNDISKLKRVEVIISQTTENQYLKQARAESASAALQAIPPSPTNDTIRAAFEAELALNMDFKDDEAKERVEKMVEMRLAIAEAQGQMTLAQLQGGAMPGQPPQGGPAPEQGQMPPQGGGAPTMSGREPVPEVPA